MPIIKLSISERRRLSVFVTCLVLALVAWVFATLSGRNNFTVQQTLIFKNAPQRRAFKALQPDTVEVTMQGTGWQMVFSRMHLANQPLTIDLHTLEHRNFIALNTQIAQINRKMDMEHKIIAFNPDTLYFDFTNRMVRKIKVQPVLNVTYQPQYAPADNIIVNPAYVTINGPASVISKINSWKTDTLKATQVNENIKAYMPLQSSREGNISVYPKTVQVFVPVDEFTEKTLKIPVRLINNPNYANVKYFPQQITIKFTTPLSRYAQVDEDFFEATADFSLWQQGYSVLPVNLVRVPAYCRVVSIQPRNIDFLVNK